MTAETVTEFVHTAMSRLSGFEQGVFMNKRDYHLDSLSTFERKYIKKAKQIAQVILTPLVKLLASCGITPNMVSLAQIPISAITIPTINNYPKLSSLLFLITLFLDLLDGELARYTHNCSRFGKIIDQFCDNFKETLVFTALISAGIVNPAWGLLYVFAHGSFILTLYACNYFRTPLPFAFKPSLMVYPSILICLWKDRLQLKRWLNCTVAISILLMSLIIIQGLRRLRKTLK